MTEWKASLQSEFNNAEAARARGNEGQARVCARRAAGIAIREYYARRGRAVHTSSAYDLLQLLVEDVHVPADIRQAANFLIMRVTKEFKLPIDVDVLAEAKKLFVGLLPESKSP